MFYNNFWKQETGTPMGSPISSIIAEIFLQSLENEFYPSFIKRNNIPYITRYVDDIFIVYDSNTINPHTINEIFNNMHPSIQYKYDVEEENKINYLDLTIYRQE
jgi:hypothetical protein